MITNSDIDNMFQKGCSAQDIVDAIVSIGDETLDFSKPQLGGGWSSMSIGGGISNVPVHTWYPDKEGCYQFHRYDPLTEEFKPDSRILRIGLYLHQIGGLRAMQAIYEATKSKNRGSMRSLDYAWNNLGDWRS